MACKQLGLSNTQEPSYLYYFIFRLAATAIDRKGIKILSTASWKLIVLCLYDNNIGNKIRNGLEKSIFPLKELLLGRFGIYLDNDRLQGCQSDLVALSKLPKGCLTFLSICRATTLSSSCKKLLKEKNQSIKIY